MHIHEGERNMDFVDIMKAQMQFHKMENLMIFLHHQNEYLSSGYKQTVINQTCKNHERQIETERAKLLEIIKGTAQDKLDELIKSQNAMLPKLERYQKLLSKHREYSEIKERHFMKPATEYQVPAINMVLAFTNDHIDFGQKSRRHLDELAKIYSEIEDKKKECTLITYDGKIKTSDAIAIALFKTLNPKMDINNVYDVSKHFSDVKDIDDLSRKEIEDNFTSFSLLPYVMNEKDLTTKLFPNGIPKQFMDDVKQFIHPNDSHVLSDIVSHINSMDMTPSQKLESAVEIIQKYYVEPYIEKGFLPDQYQQGLKMINEELQRNYDEKLELIRQQINDEMKNYSNVKKGIMILSEPGLPWQDIACKDPRVKLVIEPCGPLKDSFCLHSVPFTPGSSDVRCPIVSNPNNLSEPPREGQHKYFRYFDRTLIEAEFYIDKHEERKQEVLRNIGAGSSLEDVPNEYKGDLDVVIAAVKNDPNELQFAADFLKTDSEVRDAMKEPIQTIVNHKNMNIDTNMVR